MKYTIREMMKELTGLTDLQWGGYAFYHELWSENLLRSRRRIIPVLQTNAVKRKQRACCQNIRKRVSRKSPGIWDLP